MSITFRDLPIGALVKLGAIANLGFWTVTGTIFGLLALFGAMPINVNGSPTFGFGGLIAALLMAGVLGLVGTVLFTLGGLVARLVRPLAILAIEILSAPEVGGDQV